jgi:hypothetical protein
MERGAPSGEEVLQALHARIDAPGGVEGIWEAARGAHFCSHPVRLHVSTRTLEQSTGEILGEEADRLFLKACGNRRKTRCVACSDLYRHDARHLVQAGLAGGKEVPSSVSSHPMIFVTLTAPSFGPVHHRSKSGRGSCHPGSLSSHCNHGMPRACFEHHQADDSRLGVPLCAECYRYEEHVLFHAHLSELWRRTTIYVFRSLAKKLGMDPLELGKLVRLSYVKVAEYQARGAVHLHVVVRLDGKEEFSPPPPGIRAEELMKAFVAGSRAAYVVYPTRTAGVMKRARWGTQLDISAIDSPAAARRASRYLAKYVAKSTDSDGVLDRRLSSRRELAGLKRALSEHHRRLLECAFRLTKRRELRELNLVRSANTFGFAGHVLTKSRRYSTTFSSLRRARYEHQVEMARRRGPPANDARAELVVGHWRYGGSGYGLPTDHLVAEMLARSAIESRAEGWAVMEIERTS